MKNQFLIFLLIFPLSIVAQDKILLKGKITNSKDVEGIHILNLTTRFNSVSDPYGNFAITVKETDTLVFSSVHYSPLKVEITAEIAERRLLLVTLEELVNELDEVVLGPDLTGDLKTDIEKIEVKDPVNFQDLGIPGFTGIPEEKIVPLASAISLTRIDIEAIYKHINGYYRKLIIRRKWEAENVAVADLLDMYPATFLNRSYGIPENLSYDFIIMCVESTEIAQLYRSGSYSGVMEILSTQSKLYLARLNAKEE